MIHNTQQPPKAVKQVDSTAQEKKPLPLKDTHYFTNNLNITTLQWMQLKSFGI